MKKVILFAAFLLALQSFSNAEVAIVTVGEGTDYDLLGDGTANSPATAYRSTNVAKSLDVDGDHIYGTAGYFFFGQGGDANLSNQSFSRHSASLPAWVSSVTAGADFGGVAEYDSYSSIDNPTLTPAADVENWTRSAIATSSVAIAGNWSEVMTFTIDAFAPATFRLGIMAGNEGNSDGRWDPTGLRVSVNGGIAVAVTNLSVMSSADVGIVFFDIITDGAGGSFSIEGQQRTSAQGASIAGVTFDVGTLGDVLAGYDFDDGTGNATTAVTVKSPHVSASNYTTGAGLDDFISNNTNGLAEATDVDGNVLGTANPISFGGAQSDFGFTDMGDADDLDLAISNDDYMTFTVSAENGLVLNLNDLSFRTRANQTGNSAERWALFSSVDGFVSGAEIATGQTTDIGTWSGVSNNIVVLLSDARFQALSEITLRLYIYGGNTNSGSATLFDKVLLSGTTEDGLNVPVIDVFSVAHTDVEGAGKVAWSVSNATGVSLLDASGQVVAGVSGLQGIVDISYASGVTYTLVAANGEVQRTATRGIPSFESLEDEVTFSFDTVTVEDDGTAVGRRDPSDVIKVADTWHVWYSRVLATSPAYPSGYDASVWHASSTDEGYTWTEHAEAVPRGSAGEFDELSCFTPNILFHDGTYYLYYTGIADTNEDGSYNDEETAIGVATSDSPDGPWIKYAGNPVLEVSPDPSKFDSFRIDDTCMAVRGGKVWFYYKGRGVGLSPQQTKMGVAVADSGLGPFVRQNGGDPVQLGGHEVQIWMDAYEGVYSMVNGVGPASLTHTIQYAPDGLNFTKYADISSSEPSAPGLYRRELTNPSAGGTPEWGVYGTSQLGRYEIELPTSAVTFSFDAVSGVGPESGIYRRDPSDIIKVGDTWHVWYSKPEGWSGGPATIGHATSTNAGLDWVEQAVAIPRTPNSWDGGSAFTPNILLHDGMYYLYYTGVNDEYWSTSGYVEDQKFRIGVASSSSPYGPWVKYAGSPILVPSTDTAKFDSFRVDDSCLAVRGGKIWLYHKGRQWNNTPSNTKMGVLIADDPLGPFVRQNDGDPVQLGGHEVQIWMDAHEGVYSMVGSVGPAALKYTLQYAADGIHFSKYADVSSTYPSAPGMYRTELTDPSAGGMPSWGMYGVASLERFEVHSNDSMNTRVRLNPSSIVEGNRMGDLIASLSVSDDAAYSFEQLALADADDFTLASASVSANTVFDASLATEHGLFVRAISGATTVDGYFDVAVLEAAGIRDWRLEQFGAEVLAQSELEDSIWGDEANPDGDAFDNRGEYYADTLPMDADSVLRIDSVLTDGDSVQLTWVGGEQATQYIESSDTLDADDWDIEATYFPPTPSSNLWSDTIEPEEGKMFYRIRTERE